MTIELFVYVPEINADSLPVPNPSEEVLSYVRGAVERRAELLDPVYNLLGDTDGALLGFVAYLNWLCEHAPADEDPDISRASWMETIRPLADAAVEAKYLRGYKSEHSVFRLINQPAAGVASEFAPYTPDPEDWKIFVQSVTLQAWLHTSQRMQDLQLEVDQEAELRAQRALDGMIVRLAHNYPKMGRNCNSQGRRFNCLSVDVATSAKYWRENIVAAAVDFERVRPDV